MSYPEGRYECTEGVYEWDMSDEDTIGVRAAHIAIGQVDYTGVATVHRKESGLELALGDMYLRRRDDSRDPTLNAIEKFQDRVVEIAKEVDTEARRAQAQITSLESQQNEAVATILRSKEEIEEQEDLIEALEIELQALRSKVEPE